MLFTQTELRLRQKQPECACRMVGDEDPAFVNAYIWSWRLPKDLSFRKDYSEDDFPRIITKAIPPAQFRLFEIDPAIAPPV
jgi:hypothetical protein